MRHALILALLALLPSAAVADAVVFSSGDKQLTLVELYTSEGCSSCPPADRWLSRLTKAPELWQSVVPLGFHVDYWDYIGWQDRFARAEYSDRQRRYARDGNARTVYTPGFFANGDEWRGFFPGRRLDADQPAVGPLILRLEGSLARVEFTPASAVHGPLVINIAILGMGLETRVRAGENRGETLRHDFVVLDLSSRDLIIEDGRYRSSVRIPAVPKELADDVSGTALAAWVSRKGGQEPLQAVGGRLPDAP